MPAGLYNITDIKQGADWFLYLAFLEEDGTATSLANCTLQMMVRADYASSPVANLTTSNGITITNAANGTATIALTAAQTANIAAGGYMFDLKMVNAAGVADFEIEGGVQVAASVTR